MPRPCILPIAPATFSRLGDFISAAEALAIGLIIARIARFLRSRQFAETIYLTPARLPAAMQTVICRAVQQACTAIDVEHGQVHAEARLYDHAVTLLELAVRRIAGAVVGFAAKRKQPVAT